MLPGKRECGGIVGSNCPQENLAIFMEIVQSSVELLEQVIGNDVAARDVTKFKKRGDRLDNIRGDKSLDSVHVDLLNDTLAGARQQCKFVSCTFIRAFESSPVHWLKFQPCLNLRSPG
jgi:hypothetical protein